MNANVQTARLREIAKLNPRHTETLESSTPVSFVPMSAVTAETASTTVGEERRYSEVSKGYTPFIDGDILVAKITPCFENGKIAQAKLTHRIGFGSTEFHVVRPHPSKSDARYLLHFLRQEKIRHDGSRKMTGSAGQRRVPEHFLASLEIPLPPLEEQRRIAKILDRAEELRSKRREAIAQLDTLTQAIFLEMFGDPAFNPQKWRRVQLVDLCNSANDIKCGPFGTQLGKDEYTTEGVPLWGIKNVNALFKIPTREFLEARTAKRLMQYSIEPGDIVMTRKGTVGNCAVYPDSYPLGIMHSDLLRLRVSLQKCNSMFLSHQLHYSRDVELQLALISGGAIMPGINVTKLKSLEVLVPPMSLQSEFAHRVEAVEKLKAAYCASLSELDALFASLQHRAFRGEL
jgi:type I restriction enzyme S subunit